jgi:hypothetical protein
MGRAFGILVVTKCVYIYADHVSSVDTQKISFYEKQTEIKAQETTMTLCITRQSLFIQLGRPGAQFQCHKSSTVTPCRPRAWKY